MSKELLSNELLAPRKYVESHDLWDAGPVARKSVADIISHYLEKAGVHELHARLSKAEKELGEAKRGMSQ